MEQISQPFAAPALMPLPRIGATAVKPVPAIVLWVWLCGVAIGTVFWVRRWQRVQAIRRAATPLDLNLPIRVMSSGGRLEPGVVGIIRPALLLPEGIMSHLTPAQLYSRA
jgi:beta-lactamase regulating signal transducer with metallopeptidase domain